MCRVWYAQAYLLKTTFNASAILICEQTYLNIQLLLYGIKKKTQKTFHTD